MNILISNDDGVSAEGIHALAAEFSRDHKVTVVAPERERSTTGHYLTLHKPLRMQRLGKNIYSVSGGPADCIHLALYEIYGKRPPDLILSGINRGANLGQDVFYSGTASAAREGANQGIPSVAVSLSLDYHRPGEKRHFATAARATRRALDRVLPAFAAQAGKKGGKGWGPGLRAWHPAMMLNINVPNLPYGKLKGFAAATQGYRIYSSEILKRKDARGRDYYWIGGTYKGHRELPGSDSDYVHRGYVSLTPLELDTTMKDVYFALREQLGG